MNLPALLIHKDKILNNTRTVSSLLKERGLSMVGVAKGVLAHPEVVKAMVEGGADGLGDSRIDNLRRLREMGYTGKTVLLRAPAPSQADLAVRYADVSLNSEPATVQALGRAARSSGKVHKVILMVDLGDLREGVLAERALAVAERMVNEEGIILEGIGTNMACYGGVEPTRGKMEELLSVKREIEEGLGLRLPTVSGGNSANLSLVMDGAMPEGITELRIGEGVLLGQEAVQRRPIPGCFRDAFIIRAEVIETSTKPSKPWGNVGQDAFGRIPFFLDLGLRKRAILALGRQDVVPDALAPVDEGITIVGASSDHLICDVQEALRDVSVGDTLDFLPQYGAVLAAATSPFVEKVVVQ